MLQFIVCIILNKSDVEHKEWVGYKTVKSFVVKKLIVINIEKNPVDQMHILCISLHTL